MNFEGNRDVAAGGGVTQLVAERGSASSSSSSSASSSDSSSSGSSSEGDEVEQVEEEESFVELLIGGVSLDVPSGLTESMQILDEFFSEDIWKEVLSESLKSRLLALLPNFGCDDPAEEFSLRDSAARDLLAGKNFHFGNPLNRLKSLMSSGQLAPIRAQREKVLWRAQKRRYKQRIVERAYNLLPEILKSRKDLLERTTGVPARTPLCVLKMERKSARVAEDAADVEATRSEDAKGYFNEIRKIRGQVSASGEADFEEKDVLFPDGPPTVKKSSKKKEINILESDYWVTLDKQPAPTSRPAASSPPGRSSTSLLKAGDKETSAAGGSSKKPRIKKGKSLLQQRHKSAPSTPAVGPPTPALLPSSSSVDKKQSAEVSTNDDARLVEEAVANIPGMGDEDISAPFETKWEDAETKDPVQVVQCFFSLLRECFRRRTHFQMTIPELKEEVSNWEKENADIIRSWSASSKVTTTWGDQIPSAVAFLSGAFPKVQPTGFVEFIHCDTFSGLYQWIGSGRDSDVNLEALNEWWLQRLDFCRATTVTSGQQEVSHVSKDEEVKEFREQERRRFANPTASFTYRIRGYSSVVGPVEDLEDMEKSLIGRDFLTADSPVSFRSLVQEASCRLPGGSGSKAELTELLKESQFVTRIDETEESFREAFDTALLYLSEEKRLRIDTSQEKIVCNYFGKTEEQLAAFVRRKKALSERRQRKSPPEPIPPAAPPTSNILESALAGILDTISPQQQDSPPKRETYQNMSMVRPPASTLSPSQSQMIQVMTPTGLQTIRLAAPLQQQTMTPLLATVQRSITESPLTASTTITTTTTTLTSAPSKTSRPETLLRSTSVPSSLMLSPQKKAPDIASPAVRSEQSQLQQSLLRLPMKPEPPSLLNISSADATSPSLLKTAAPLLKSPPTTTIQVPSMPNVYSLLSNQASQQQLPRPATPVAQQASQIHQQQPQKFLIQDSEGNPVHLSQAQFQKLLGTQQQRNVVIQQEKSSPAGTTATTSMISSPGIAGTSTIASGGQPPISAAAAVKQVLASVAQQPPAKAVGQQAQVQPQQVLRVPSGPASESSQVGTSAVRYVSLSQNAATGSGTVMRIIAGGGSGTNMQLQQPQVVQVPVVKPQVMQVPVVRHQAQQQPVVRLPPNLSVGQKVTVGGKPYLVAKNSLGQQVLTPAPEQQQQVLIQGQPVVLQNVRVVKKDQGNV